MCLVGGAEYMIVFSDRGSSYHVGYFLTSKSSKATLSAFTEYHVKSERETGRKLVQLRVDMGSEFFNIKWKEYTMNHGITVEFSAPYAHGQNGVAEHGMRTIIEGVRSAAFLLTLVYLHHCGPMLLPSPSTLTISFLPLITLDLSLLRCGWVSIKTLHTCIHLAAWHMPRSQRNTP